MRHDRPARGPQTHEITRAADCPLRGGPCLAGFAFLARLGVSCHLAGQITGEAPVLAGAVTLQDCPVQAGCTLDWRAEAGRLELSGMERVLLRGRLVTAQRV